MLAKQKKTNLANRFRGLLPVVIDVETSGLKPDTDALLEIAAVFVTMDEKGKICPSDSYDQQIEPFFGARIDPKALRITHIDLTQPLRYAIPEAQALHELFAKVTEKLAETRCHRAVLVGHNAWFDLTFMLRAAERAHIKTVPFHSFTTFDTASLAAVALGETVLARALRAANIFFDVTQAHSALYDAQKTAELFCAIVNRS